MAANKEFSCGPVIRSYYGALLCTEHFANCIPSQVVAPFTFKSIPAHHVATLPLRFVNVRPLFPFREIPQDEN